MKKIFVIVSCILILAGCGKTTTTPTASRNPAGGRPATEPDPTKATLSFPEQDGLCITGTDISDSLNTIAFTWSAGKNTDSFEVHVKNLINSVSTVQTTTQTQLAFILKKATPFSWYVISKSAKTSATAQSDIWKFYNAGKGIISYAPFPADIKSPAYGENITAGPVNLSWQGSSIIAGTIVNYDIYLGTNKTPGLLKAAVTDNFLMNVTVTPNSTYYWKIITRDISGNTSESGISVFTVQ